MSGVKKFENEGKLLLYQTITARSCIQLTSMMLIMLWSMVEKDAAGTKRHVITKYVEPIFNTP